MLRFFMILLLPGFCALGCQSSNESRHGETSQSHDLPPPEVLQTNSFANLKDLLPKVQKGMTEKELVKTLGSPQDRYEENALKMFTYVERPGEFGTMKYVRIEISNGLVERVSEGEISIDPW
ncbi:MAG: hypothetical protein JSW27_18690 [Phycisphaerales bacterium]|nr:MAG: hypothetical protein JSW27_18690 [Phycisphaerales bacterium]